MGILIPAEMTAISLEMKPVLVVEKLVGGKISASNFTHLKIR